MIMYNQAFDLYHTIYRMLQFLNRFDTTDTIELDRLRIWDFYLLFPNKTFEIRLKHEDREVRELRNRFFKKTNNPYMQVHENRKVFEKIKPYQIAALNCIASYGIIDKDLLRQNRITILNKEILTEYVKKIGELSAKETNTITLLANNFYSMTLFGSDGLKSRTNLMEGKYDA